MAEGQQKQQNVSQTNEDPKERVEDAIRFRPSNEVKKHDPDAAPMLKFGPGKNLV
jgi:hypothetical protein